MNIKKIFIKNKKRILAAAAALIIVAVTVVSAQLQNGASQKNDLDANVLVAGTKLVASNEPILRAGSASNNVTYVRELQTDLYSFGYYTVSVDGLFGPETETAVKAFQTAKGLTADGIVGAGTWAAIDNAVASGWKCERPILSTSSPSNKAAYITALQNALISFGYSLTADGIFGLQTRNAVKDFQAAHNLTADGNVSAATWAAIDSASASGWSILPVEVPTSTIPTTSTLTCTANKTTVNSGETVTFTAATNYSLGASGINWVEANQANRVTMVKTGDKTMSISSVLVNTGTADKIFLSAVSWIDEGTEVTHADCNPVTIHPQQSVLTPTTMATQTTTTIPITTVTPAKTTTTTTTPATTKITTTPSTAVNTSQPPAPDMLRCKIFSEELVISTGIPIRIDCTLDKNALVTAQIIKGDYKPPQAPDESAIIENLLYNQVTQAKAFYLLWDGIDRYDLPVEEGDYTFVVGAKLSSDANSDYSVHKFKVVLQAPAETRETQVENPTQESAPAVTPEEHAAAPEATQEAPPTPEPSKCPGVNYPADISGHWAESVIKQAYDLCIVQGVDAEHFNPDGSVSRAEVVKVAMLAAGKTPETGCYDADCGSPFTDLEMWQGPWIRAAWNAHIIYSSEPDKFHPNDGMTRAESAALIAKTFEIPPHRGCYTANCGAGQPDNIFNDIFKFWQGPWLRALWDAKLIVGTAPHQFSPDRAITRAELVKLVMSAKH
jgi:peptidoglycan hydrolase-like protein with peptidoglycan-binding domain